MTNGSSEKSTWTVGYNHSGEMTRRYGCCFFLSLSLPSSKWVIMFYPTSTFLKLGIINTLDQIFFCCGVLSSCRVFSHISGFYPLDAKSNPSMTTEMFPDMDKYPLGAKSPLWELLLYKKQNYLFPSNSGGKFLTNYLCVCKVTYKSYIFWIQWIYFSCKYFQNN